MKVTKEHRQILHDLISQLDTPSTRNQYRNGNYQRAEFTKDVNKRYRWDLYWASRTVNPAKFIEIMDAGYKDAHLDTALRSIVAEL